jgi:glycosyltransferase involved in cell wall biosynthesis
MPSPAPQVAAIVPCHDYGRFLPEAIASLQAQTFPGWELVVVDDGSTDDTPHVVAAMMAQDTRIRYVRREPAGVSAARNAGLAASTAPLIQFLDADDRLEPDKLRIHVEYLERHKHVGIVYGDAAAFGTLSGSTGISGLQSSAPVSTGLSAIRPLVMRNGLVIHAPLSRRVAIEGVGGFREDMILLEDWDLWLRCAVAGVAFARETQEGARALVRVHPEGASRDPDRMLAATVELRSRFGALNLPLEAARLNARHLARAQAKLALLHLRRGRWRKAVAEMLQTVLGLADVHH